MSSPAHDLFRQEALAARLGKSRPAIANALRLLQLSPAAQDDLHHGRLSAGHARQVRGSAALHRLEPRR